MNDYEESIYEDDLIEEEFKVAIPGESLLEDEQEPAPAPAPALPAKNKRQTNRHNKLLGAKGEDAAVRYLLRRGYQVLERNWKCNAGEADIIARDDHYLVFIEVKTRKDEDRGLPEEAVGAEKRNRYERIAASYLRVSDIVDMQIRFDVIGILVIGPDRAMMRHHINAFGVA
ncbi:MAG: YraN family protein [Coriobacteriia bacterium]|nr:YraN family protein [Coriobacteriia bacterium]